MDSGKDRGWLMAIVTMKKLSLLAMREQREQLVRDLMLLGCVEISEPDPALADPEMGQMLHREQSDTAARKTDRKLLQTALEVLESHAPEKKKLLSARPEVSMQTFLDDTDVESALKLAKRVVDRDETVRHKTAEISRLRSHVASLRAWRNLDIPLDSEGTKQCCVVFGTVPLTTEITTLETRLDAVTEEAALFHIDTGKELHYLEFICFRDMRHDCIKALREEGFSVVAFPGITGTAVEGIEAAEREQMRLQREVNALSEEIGDLASYRREFQLCYDRMETQVAEAQAEEKLCATEQVLYLLGWIPKPKITELETLLSRYDCAWELADPDPEHLEEVPIALQNSVLVKPMNMVTEMYSLPAYNGIDPNPLMMPFFTIFFGVMLADMGYGLLMALAGFIIKKKMRPKGGMANAAGLLMLCGISAFVFGALTGGFFGDAIPTVLGMYGVDFTMPALLDPLSDPMVILIASLAIGGVQILVGMGINAYMLIRDGQWKDALFDVGSWWLLFAGVALGVLGITWYVCFAGLAALVLTQGRDKPTVPGKLISGIASLYDITSYFGDVLSYSRLMALMLASSVVASVVNTLGSLAGSIIVFVIIFIVGHSVNLGLNLIGTFVHAARLQYLEYFGKFYRDGGKPFRPLAVNTQYVDVKEDL